MQDILSSCNYHCNFPTEFEEKLLIQGTHEMDQPARAHAM